MIRDEELRSSADYSEGQTEAARRVLVELVNLFDAYKDEIRVVGGWVPDLMFPDEGHIGSVDVDLLINHLTLKDTGYQTMAKILLKNGYKEHPDKYFSFVKTIQIDGIDYDVDVDILAGMYGGTQKKKRSQHVQGIKALKATSGNFAFEFDAQDVRVEAKRPDAAQVIEVGTVKFTIGRTNMLMDYNTNDCELGDFILKRADGTELKMIKQEQFYKNGNGEEIHSIIWQLENPEKYSTGFGSVDNKTGKNKYGFNYGFILEPDEKVTIEADGQIYE